MARFMFCAVPAVLWGIVGFLLHPAIGVVFAACVFGHGWQVTTAPKPEGSGHG